MSQSRRLRAERRKSGLPQPAAEKQPEHRLILGSGARKLAALVLLAVTIAGLFLGLDLAFSYPLTSDSANAGLFPMEVAHGNFGYVFPDNNPYFFTDYVFHLIIQPLTGYSPVALVLTGYAMYVLIVLACAALALRLAGRMEALAAAALVANLPFTGLRYVLYPLYHNGTILFILLSILVFYADRPPFRLSVRWRVLIVGLLQFLGVFSDTLMLPVFTLPLIVYSAYRLWGQRRGEGGEEEKDRVGEEGGPALWLASTVPALLIYVLKTRISQLWPGGPILAAAADLGSAGSLMQHPEMASDYVSALLSDTGGIALAAIILAMVLFAIFVRRDRFLQTVMVAGGIFMLIGFLSMTVAGDPGRYLTPVAILALTVAATVTMRRELSFIPLAAVVLIVLVNIGSNVQTLEQPHPDYNQAYQGLITFLEDHNITHAYADYWSANIYTYMSGGKVTIEPCTVQDGKLQFHSMNAAPEWARIWPDGNDTMPVIITLEGDGLYEWTQEINENHPPVTSYQLGNGWAYVYNGTLPAWPAGE